MKPEQPTLLSWWLKDDVPRDGFTAYVEKEHQIRMSAQPLKGSYRVERPTEER